MVRCMSDRSGLEPRESPEARVREEADFGFRRVPAGAKKHLVREVFDTVARRYDLMNDLMSAGIHRMWKDAMVDWLAPRPGQTIVDVAGGTGDVAFRLAARTKGQCQVMVCDANEQMVRIGRDRALDRGVLAGIDWLVGDAQDLPVVGNCADAYTIAFGLRNVTDIEAALREAKRVLKPGGRFLCLEFSRVTVPLLDDLYRRFSFFVIPWIGGRVTGNREAYRYLVESIRRFPPQHLLAERIERAGLGQVRVRNLSGGIAAMHSAWRL